jgi:hypothetical protein
VPRIIHSLVQTTAVYVCLSCVTSFLIVSLHLSIPYDIYLLAFLASVIIFTWDEQRWLGLHGRFLGLIAKTNTPYLDRYLQLQKIYPYLLLTIRVVETLSPNTMPIGWCQHTVPNQHQVRPSIPTSSHTDNSYSV